MRVANRLIATLLALGVVLAGVLVVVESISGLTGNGPAVVPWDRWLSDLQARPWADIAVRLVAAGAIVLGLLFLLAGVSARDQRLALRSEHHPDVVLTTTARAVARSLRHRGQTVPGVSAVNVRVNRRRAVVRATARLQAPQAVYDGLQRELGATMNGLPLLRPPRLRIRVRGTHRDAR